MADAVAAAPDDATVVLRDLHVRYHIAHIAVIGGRRVVVGAEVVVTEVVTGGRVSTGGAVGGSVGAGEPVLASLQAAASSANPASRRTRRNGRERSITARRLPPPVE